jgi:uncharacterized protein YciI
VFVLTVSYVRPLEEIDAQLAAHRAYLDRFYASGVLLSSGPRVPRTGGVILARFADRAAAESFVAGDPFTQAGVARYEVIEFTATRAANALQALRDPA